MDGDEGEVTSGALPASLRDLLRALSCDDERESPRVCLLLWAKKRICSVFVLVCVCKRLYAAQPRDLKRRHIAGA